MSKTGFSFKQFHIEHDRCAMKVNTDSIVLGAWVKIEQARHILDLGTGSGLLALMMAQRAPEAKICAVEIEPSAVAQAQQNINTSPWAERIQCIEQDIALFAQQHPQLFDLVIANPPYFNQGPDCSNAARNQARYTLDHTHLDWLRIAQQCLTSQGSIHFVLPFLAGEQLLKYSPLPCIRYCTLQSTTNKPAQRLLLSFSPQPRPTEYSQLVIYNNKHQYSPEFRQLTRDFYLGF